MTNHGFACTASQLSPAIVGNKHRWWIFATTATAAGTPNQEVVSRDYTDYSVQTPR